MKKQTVGYMILVMGFFACICGVFILQWVIPDRSFSEDENRSLQTLPTFSLDHLKSGTYTSKWGKYISDQIPFRSLWVGLYGTCEVIREVGESNGVLAARTAQGTQLAVRRFNALVSPSEVLENTDLFSEDHVVSQLEAVNELQKTLSSQSISLCVCFPPRTVDVTASAYPSYPTATTDRMESCLSAALSPDVTHVSLLSHFQTLYEEGSPVYYRTDHHWTTQGAYEAYTALLPALGFEDAPVLASAFDVETIPDFFGTTGSRSGLFSAEPDTLEIWHLPDDDRYAVHDERGELLFYGFIDESYLSKKDKYAAFLSGNHRLLTVTDTQSTEDRSRLLVVKDSFANCLVPFLARHADLVVVNLSAGMTNVSELVEQYDCAGVLILYNWENLITSDHLRQVH